MSEYWIADGIVLGAGDEGDTNHVGHVINAILSQHDVDEHFDLDSVDDEWLKNKGMDDEEINVLRSATGDRQFVNHVDPREYAIKKWGWIRVANRSLQVWTIDNGSLREMANGLYEIYGEEQDEESIKTEFDIEVMGNKVKYSGVPYYIIAKEDVTLLFEYRFNYAKASNWYRYSWVRQDINPWEFVVVNPSKERLVAISKKRDGTLDNLVRAFLIDNQLFVWDGWRALHATVDKILDKMQKENAIPLELFLDDDGIVGVMVTDYSRHTKWHHNVDLADFLIEHPLFSSYLSKNYEFPDQLEISYYDEAVVGDWQNIQEEHEEVQAFNLTKRYKMAQAWYTIAVAKDPKTSPEILKQILEKGNRDGVLYYAVQNPNCPPEALAMVLKSGDNDYFSQLAINNPNCPLDAKLEWMEKFGLLKIDVEE